MTNILREIFLTKRPIIGMVHLLPLLGYSGSPGLKAILKRAITDAKTLKEGGVDGIMIENNYDLPHKIFVGPETVACMTVVAAKIIKRVDLPMGINVLWNDYKASLAIAKTAGAKFIRLPVFVDKVRTNYGDVLGDPKEVIKYRKQIGAEEIYIFADIQVKHAKMLEKKDVTVSARQAIKAGADAIIITGKWTGDPPELAKIKRVRRVVGKFPVLIGSGVTKENILELLNYADGIIVGTSFKTSHYPEDKTNIKNYLETIELQKVKEFVRVVKMLK